MSKQHIANTFVQVPLLKPVEKITLHLSAHVEHAFETPFAAHSPSEQTPQAAPEYSVATESEWSRRYMAAAERYDGLDLGSQEAVDTVIKGLQEWARLVPQRSVGTDGVPQPANKWSLGIERCVVRSIHSHLVAIGQPLLAARIHAEMSDLMETAASLDACYLELPDDHAEKRLAATARIQTKSLIKLLSAIQLECNRSVDDGGTPRRKRGHPLGHNPVEDRRLMDEWSQVRGRAGMQRKEFCALKGITIQAFVQTQDRFRKQAALAANNKEQ